MSELHWSTEDLPGGGRRHEVRRDGAPLSWRELAAGLARDAALRRGLTETIASSEHAGVYWETRPVSAASTSHPFEMVVLPARQLASRSPDPDAFAEHLAAGSEPVRRFSNLGRDARLVVPCELGPRSAYGHLAAFVREAPPAQVDALWQAVGAELEAWWSTQSRPLWLSTAGDGVPWLHVRLDRRPKYYSHSPYREAVP